MVGARVGIDPFPGCISEGYVVGFGKSSRTIVLLFGNALLDGRDDATLYHVVRQAAAKRPGYWRHATCTTRPGDGLYFHASSNPVFRCAAQRHYEHHQFSNFSPGGHLVGKYCETHVQW